MRAGKLHVDDHKRICGHYDNLERLCFLAREGMPEKCEERPRSSRSVLMTFLIACAVAGLAVGPARAAVVEAVEYHHAGFDHYFVTAFPDEIAVLDGGAFGGVWKRTGQTFKVENTQSPTSNAAVCRFFSTSFAPRSSHFYTALASECTTVMSNPNWQYEGQAYYIAPPTTAGACATGYTKVYRLYNNGKSGAPNHRYTTSATVRTQMINQGWMPEGYGEGVAFCSPNSGANDAFTRASKVLGGSWYITYSFGISYTDKLTFTRIYRNTGSNSVSMPYLLEGVGPFNRPVDGGYSAVDDFYIAWWTFSSGNYNGYGFEFTGPNTITGCYDYDAHYVDLFDYCAPLSGYRSPAQAGMVKDEATTSEAEHEFQKRIFRSTIK